MRKNTFKTAVLVTALSLSNVMVFMPTAALAADATVRLAGHAAFDVGAAAGGYSAISRAEIMQKNLDNALVASANRGPAAVNVSYNKGIPIITVGGYYIGTADNASAKAVGTTPAVLAQRWANSLKTLLSDQNSVNTYVAQLTGGDRTVAGNVSTDVNYPLQPQSTMVYIPAGLTLPVVLQTSISSETARPGDMVEARLENPIQLGQFSIPAGSLVTGSVIESEAGRRGLVRRGALEVAFNSLRLPNGQAVPIHATVQGGISETQRRGLLSGVTGNPVGRTLVEGGVGAGLGAALGTAIGAIAGGGHGVGRGAWSGAAIGGGVGALHALFLAKGANVVYPSGQRLTIQLQAPAQVAVTNTTGMF